MNRLSFQSLNAGLRAVKAKRGYQFSFGVGWFRQVGERPCNRLARSAWRCVKQAIQERVVFMHPGGNAGQESECRDIR